MSAPVLAAIIPPSDLILIRALAERPITCPTEAEAAVNGLAWIKARQKDIEAARVEKTGPLNAEIRAINAEAKRAAGPLDEAETALKRALLAWRVEEQRRLEAERRRVAEENAARERAAREREAALKAEAESKTLAEAQAAGFAPEEAAELAQLEAADVSVPAPLREVAPPDQLPTVKATAGAATVRMVWTFRVVDPALVPREFLTVDETAIRRAVAAGARSIPGVEITEQPQVAARGF